MENKCSVDKYKVDSIDLFITEECNMNCKYCFHNTLNNRDSRPESVLTVEQGKKILDRMYQINSDQMHITFFGGEPLLYPETVLELAKYARTLWKNVLFHVSTNGTYFDETMLNEYHKLNFSFQISFDGDKDTTETNRGNFELIRDNILKTLKIFPGLTIRMTYTPETVGLLMHNIQFIHELGVKHIMHHATMESDWDEEAINQYGYQLSNLYHYRRFMQRRNIPLFCNFIDKNLQILNDEARAEVEYCMAGKTYLAVLNNGDVYPCHRAASNRLFKLGNIFNEKRPFVRGLFLDINKDTTGCSRFCEASRTCHTCIVTHYIVNKDLTKPLVTNKYCDICKMEYNMAKAYLPTELTDKNERMLNKIALVVSDMAEVINKIEGEHVKK